MTRPGPQTPSNEPHRSDALAPGRPPHGRGPSALVWRWWNLLLLLPLLMLVTPWFNKDKPRVLGLPFFYWYQLAFVFVGVACVWIVYAATRSAPASTLPPAVASSPDDPAAGRSDAGARA